jgi:hypothetical protein
MATEVSASGKHEDTRHHKVQRSELSQANPAGHADHESIAVQPIAMLGDAQMEGRGNGSVRRAIVQGLQQTVGNRATQRMLQRIQQAATIHRGVDAASTPIPASHISLSKVGPQTVVQRLIAITPAAYAQGIGVDIPNLTKKQINEYLKIAVNDDYVYAVSMATEAAKKATEGEKVEAEQKLNDLKTKGNAVMEDTASNVRVQRIADLVTAINNYLNENDQIWEDNYQAQGTGAVITRPNRKTRYATTPEGDYKHRSLTTSKAEGIKWGTDKKMWQEFGEGVGKDVENKTFGTVKAVGQKTLPLQQLPWETAKKLLPRPLINLIFDVRFQLESGGATVIDERTQDEKDRKVKSPNAPGTLRSWHQDSPGVLPDNKFNPQNIPGSATALHAHYNTTSQSGAGSSIGEGVSSAQGFAEYTGTGSNWEHNTKVVLDYINKKVYLTLTHYQYWALIPRNDTYEFWASGTQSLDSAQGKLNEVKDGDKATMMSPWMEILMPS